MSKFNKFIHYSTIFRDPSCIDTTNIIGFILNVPSNYKIGFVRLPLQRRHWISVKQINGEYWNLDSKLDAPQVIGDVRNCDVLVMNMFLFPSFTILGISNHGILTQSAAK